MKREKHHERERERDTKTERQTNSNKQTCKQKAEGGCEGVLGVGRGGERGERSRTEGWLRGGGGGGGWGEGQRVEKEGQSPGW